MQVRNVNSILTAPETFHAGFLRRRMRCNGTTFRQRAYQSKACQVLDNDVVEGYLEWFRSEASEKGRTEVGKDDGIVIDRLFT